MRRTKEDWVIKMRRDWEEHQRMLETNPKYARAHEKLLAKKRAALAELLRLEDELGLDN